MSASLWIAVLAAMTLDVLLLIVSPGYRRRSVVDLPMFLTQVIAVVAVAYVLHLGLVRMWRVKPSFPELGD